jgi:glycerol-3-phosphate dehydrogenase
MQRDLRRLSKETYDLLVIGGGAFGAAAAWDGALRGLSVALIERSDFGGGASAECFKMVHGGIRYLQHGDVRRLRASCHERSALLRIAPHLVSPLPIVIPTYGHGRQGKALLAAGMWVYDGLTFGKNARIGDPQRRIARPKLLSRRETLTLFPELESRSLTGGAVFEDGQMYNTARLVLAFVRSAARRGAHVANYLEATAFLWDGDRICGVRARDRLKGDELEIRARLVLNAAGPWADYLLEDPRFGGHQRGHFSRDACFIVDRRPSSRYALAVPGATRDSDALVSRSARHLFAVPWRDRLLIGVWHRLFPARPDAAEVEEAELAAWIAEINAAYPPLRLKREDVLYAHCGLVPFGDETSSSGELSFGKESRLLDHRVQGVQGLVTIIGIRYTTARGDAGRALDLLLEQHPNAPPRPATERTALVGGDIEDTEALLRRARVEAAGLAVASVESWVRNYGTEYRALLERARAPGEAARLGAGATVLAEVSHAVSEEMALRLEDVVLRRTDLGSGEHPGRAALEAAAARMRALLGWSEDREREELAATEEILARHRAAPRAPMGL